MARYIFVFVSADREDSLDVSMHAEVVEAEDEEHAWSQVETAWDSISAGDDEYEEMSDRQKEAERHRRKREREVCRSDDGQRVAMVKLIPTTLGWHSLAY